MSRLAVGSPVAVRRAHSCHRRRRTPGRSQSHPCPRRSPRTGVGGVHNHALCRLCRLAVEPALGQAEGRPRALRVDGGFRSEFWSIACAQGRGGAVIRRDRHGGEAHRRGGGFLVASKPSGSTAGCLTSGCYNVLCAEWISADRPVEPCHRPICCLPERRRFGSVLRGAHRRRAVGRCRRTSRAGCRHSLPQSQSQLWAQRDDPTTPLLVDARMRCVT